MRQLLFLFLFFLATSLTLAAGRSGPEWTFTSDELIELGRINDSATVFNSSEGQERFQNRMLSQWAREIKLACPSCKIKKQGSIFSISRFHVQVSEDVWFEVSRDPWVLEVTASPMNKTTFAKHSEVFQKLVWNIAEKIGIRPHSRVGGGHIHLEIESFFGNDRNLFRNFLVDLANHPELFLGALGFDLLNAPPMAILFGKQKQNFEKIILEFDKGTMSINELMAKINFEVYNETFYDPYTHQQHNPEKYQAVNLSHKETLELRGISPQGSAYIHFLLIQLFEARIDFLKKQPGLIPYNKKDYSSSVHSFSVRKMEFHTSNIDPSLIEQKARSYIQESGLNWSDYSGLVLKNLSTVQAQATSCKTAVGL